MFFVFAELRFLACFQEVHLEGSLCLFPTLGDDSTDVVNLWMMGVCCFVFYFFFFIFFCFFFDDIQIVLLDFVLVVQSVGDFFVFPTDIFPGHAFFERLVEMLLYLLFGDDFYSRWFIDALIDVLHGVISFLCLCYWLCSACFVAL